jgi:hypothetical protein
MKLTRKTNPIRQSIWEPCARWGRRWLEYLPSVPVDGYELYMKWPGERMPPPSPRSAGPHWDIQEEDWELAA